MEEVWYSSISRVITILLAIVLYGLAMFTILRRPKKVKSGSTSSVNRASLFDYSGPERRVYPRASLGTGIRYKICTPGKGLHTFREGRARNISEGGVHLEIQEVLTTNAKLELKLRLPDVSHFILIRGDVVWSKEIEPGKCYDHGISFTEIDPNDRKLIAKYVAEVQPSTDSS